MKKIYIDAGHGGEDPGAVSGSFYEAPMALKIAVALARYLDAYDCVTRLSRATDIFLTPQAQYREAIAWGADMSVCCHLNAGGGEGFEVFAWHTDERSKSFGKLMAAEMPGIGQKLRSSAYAPGVKLSKEGSYNFGMVRELAKKGIIAVLAEAAFVDNAKDQARINTDAKLAAFGEAYGRAVVKHLGLTPKCKPAPVKPAPAPTKKSPADVASEIIAGKGGWGNNPQRKQKLEAAGYNYDEVQGIVTALMQGQKPAGVIRAGSTVKVMQGARDYDGRTIKSFVFPRKHKVKSIKGDRAVITFLGITVAAVSTNNLYLA